MSKDYHIGSVDSSCATCQREPIGDASTRLIEIKCEGRAPWPREMLESLTTYVYDMDTSDR